MAATATFLWHDYETFGTDPRRDRPAQFACWRTDAELQPLGEPESFYCQPPADYLPDPEACLLTGLLPQAMLARGLPEPAFADAVQQRMGQPGTCNAGYNSIRFDDEVSRHLFWRNFHEPYAHEWAQGNSRFDLIDVLRLAHALRPEGLQWPSRDGLPSFKLELLAAANGVEQARAHNAADDVIALVGLARKLRAAQPRLWQHALQLRAKAYVGELLDLADPQVLVHVSQRFPAERACLALVWPLVRHPHIAGRILVADLAVDPLRWALLPAEQLAERLYAPRDSALERLPLKAVHLNRVPMLAPLSVLRTTNLERLKLDPGQCLAHAEQLRALPDLPARVAQAHVLASREWPRSGDADSALYDDLVGEQDRRLCRALRECPADELGARSFRFADARLHELHWRRRARWFAATLDPAEARRWQAEAAQRLHAGSHGWRSFADFDASLARLRESRGTAAAELQALQAWGESCRQRYTGERDAVPGTVAAAMS